MKRTIIAVISIVLIAFAFTACRQSVVIPFDPMPGPNTPSEPSVPDDTIQVGDKTYKYLEDAIAEAAAGSTIEIGAGEYRVTSAISVSKDITIVGAGMDAKTIIKVNGNTAFNITGSSATISNLTIQDTADPSARKLINVESSKIVIDSVRFEGLYTDTDGDIRYYGIVTNADVSDVTIKNSVFKGFKIPVLLDFDNVENPKATISGNTFDTFNKLSFSNYNDSINISPDNEFVNPTNKEYQIELFKGDSLTAEQAISVAKNTGLVVKAELEDGVYYNFDAEGALISTVDQLAKFANGSVGTVAKLVNEEAIEITSIIRFTADGLTLNADNKSIESTVTEGIVIQGKGIKINNAVVSYTGTSGSVLIKNQGEGTTISGGEFTGIYNTAEANNFNGITSNKPITVIGAKFSKFRMPVCPDGEAAGSVIQNNTFDTCFKVEVKADELDSITLTGNSFTNGLASSDIVITGDATEDIAKTVSENNNDCKVKYGESSIYPEA